MTEPLFDVAPQRVQPAEPLSADRARTQRQLAAVAGGAHPLALVVAGVQRHPDTRGLTYDRHAQGGITCGGCRHRTEGGRWAFPKCTFGDGARISHGAATDVRAWWPACADYEVKR